MQEKFYAQKVPRMRSVVFQVGLLWGLLEVERRRHSRPRTSFTSLLFVDSRPAKSPTCPPFESSPKLLHAGYGPSNLAISQAVV